MAEKRLRAVTTANQVLGDVERTLNEALEKLEPYTAVPAAKSFLRSAKTKAHYIRSWYPQRLRILRKRVSK